MAIKGKGKTRSRRVIAAPPRPPIYVRKKPFWARRWFQVTVGVLVIGAIAVGAFLYVGNRSEQKLLEQTRTAVRAFGVLVQGKFPPNAQPQPPTRFVMYPNLPADLTGIENGSVKPDGAIKRGRDLGRSAKASGDALQAIVVRDTIPIEAEVTGLPSQRGPGATRIVMLDAQFMMVQAFRLYETVGGLMQAAGNADAAERRKAIVTQARSVMDRANTLFDRGWQKLVNVRTELGIQSQTSFPTA